LTGNSQPSPNFCVDAARALGESPEKLLRLAGFLSPSDDDPALTELQDIAKNLPPQKREELLRYAKYLQS
jgi:hypothetical protein